MIERVQSSKEEVEEILNVARRDLAESKEAFIHLSGDWAFNIAYSAMLQAARALMLMRGFRSKGAGSHFSVIEFIKSEYGTQIPAPSLDAFDKGRRKRNRATYEHTGTITASEAQNMVIRADEFVEAIGKIIQPPIP
jgi:uncharacterized protein (UPF0332 family)